MVEKAGIKLGSTLITAIRGNYTSPIDYKVRGAGWAEVGVDNADNEVLHGRAVRGREGEGRVGKTHR